MKKRNQQRCFLSPAECIQRKSRRPLRKGLVSIVQTCSAEGKALRNGRFQQGGFPEFTECKKIAVTADKKGSDWQKSIQFVEGGKSLKKSVDKWKKAWYDN